MSQNLEDYKRQFSEPIEKLEDFFFQILLHEYYDSLFSRSDWTDFTLSYGQLFYTYETLWASNAEEFEGLQKSEIQKLLESGFVIKCNKSFEEMSTRMSDILKGINFDLSEAYIDLLDLNSFIVPGDINHPVIDVFSAIKGNFPVIDHGPGIWCFNAVNLGNKLQELITSFNELLKRYITWDVANFLSSFVNYSDKESLKLHVHVSGEKEAITQEWGLQPDLLTWPIDRIIYVIGLKYCKDDGSSLTDRKSVV